MAPSVDVGIELGGTKVVVAASTGGATLSHRARIDTTDPVSTLAAVRRAVAGIASSAPISAIGIGSFGPLDLRPQSPGYGTIVRTPKAGWSGVDVLTGVTAGLDVPTAIDTDVNAALRGEHAHGAGRIDSVMYLTVGTGIGGGIWAGGGIVEGANHPEMGHVTVPTRPGDDFPGVCPYHGRCLEGMASGPALEARYGRPPEALAPHDAEAASDLVAHYLAHGIVSMCSVIPVMRVIIGGGVANLPGLRERVVSGLPDASGLYPPIPFAEGGPEIVAPGLGDDAGVVGAIELAVGERTAGSSRRGAH
jgi:fructokinase